MVLSALIDRSGVCLGEVLPDAEVFGAQDVRVTSCSGDSRRVRPGDAFVALCGTRSDGHDHIDEAIARGAQVLVTERPVPTIETPVYVVSDTREAYGHLCQALAGHPGEHLQVIGVTGTNGKTTTAHLISGVLQQSGRMGGTIGTLGYTNGLDHAPATHTTPPAPMLAHWLAQMAGSHCDHAILEVSSHALSQRRVSGISFDAVTVTNVTRDHLDYHGSVTNYREAKARIFEQLRPGGIVILNADDPVCASWLSRITEPVLTVGMTQPAEIQATLVERHLGEQTFLITAGSETVPVRTRMIGDHHVMNCLTATALGLAYGLDLTTIAAGLEAVSRVPGRMETIACGQPFAIYVDYAHTPEALAKSLQALRDVTSGRIHCVFGAGGDRDSTKRPAMGSVVRQLADVAVVTSDNPRYEDPQVIAHQLIGGCDRSGDFHIILDRRQAICWALDSAQPGDSVLIAGKGHETEQIIGSKRYCHDDRALVREHLVDF